ncbi:MAG: M48 family metallopeptidase [Thermales bacterium]|nr:M48 family metallopeptidase [Thermales bacterium]
MCNYLRFGIINLMQQVYTTIFQGKKIPVFVDDSLFWSSLKMSSGRILIKKSLAGDIQKFTKEYNIFCKTRLEKIINKQVNKLLNKRVKVNIKYLKSDGTKFTKSERLSAKDHIKALEYNPTKIIIDLYEKQWGINKVDNRNKNYELHFNLNLIKYGTDDQIQYVVAHEITHIFYRNHDQEFYNLLRDYTGWGEKNSGIFGIVILPS